MYRNESITNNLLDEVESLSCRSTNIRQSYFNTAHNGLRDRMFSENQNILKRLKEILLISKILKKRNVEKISFSSLLLEKCERTIAQTRIENNLFFL